MKKTLLAALVAAPLATTALASEDAVPYAFDAGHSQIVFTYDHLGFSTTYGMFSGFEGEILFDAASPENSSVTVTFPVESMITGWDARSQHFLQSGDFFNLGDFPEATFTSTSIEVTGENTANITGDLTLNGVTKEVVLDTVLNQQTDSYPIPPFEGKAAIGLSATTTLIRSDYNLGAFTPFIADEIPVMISLEAMATE